MLVCTAIKIPPFTLLLRDVYNRHRTELLHHNDVPQDHAVRFLAILDSTRLEELTPPERPSVRATVTSRYESRTKYVLANTGIWLKNPKSFFSLPTGEKGKGHLDFFSQERENDRNYEYVLKADTKFRKKTICIYLVYAYVFKS